MPTLQRKRPKIRTRLLSVLSIDDETDLDTKEMTKRKISALVMWYPPVIDHLKHVFSNHRDAELVH
jgi:hypothetical protein